MDQNALFLALRQIIQNNQAANSNSTLQSIQQPIALKNVNKESPLEAHLHVKTSKPHVQSPQEQQNLTHQNLTNQKTIPSSVPSKPFQPDLSLNPSNPLSHQIKCTYCSFINHTEKECKQFKAFKYLQNHQFDNFQQSKSSNNLSTTTTNTKHCDICELSNHSTQECKYILSVSRKSNQDHSKQKKIQSIINHSTTIDNINSYSNDNKTNIYTHSPILNDSNTPINNTTNNIPENTNILTTSENNQASNQLETQTSTNSTSKSHSARNSPNPIQADIPKLLYNLSVSPKEIVETSLHEHYLQASALFEALLLSQHNNQLISLLFFALRNNKDFQTYLFYVFSYLDSNRKNLCEYCHSDDNQHHFIYCDQLENDFISNNSNAIQFIKNQLQHFNELAN